MDLCAKKRISSDRRKFITALAIFPETLPSLYSSRITAIPQEVISLSDDYIREAAA
jgi:hypothetical protein